VGSDRLTQGNTVLHVRSEVLGRALHVLGERMGNTVLHVLGGTGSVHGGIACVVRE